MRSGDRVARGVKLTIREATERDLEQWMGLRQRLWPDCPPDDQDFEVRSILSASNGAALLAFDGTGEAIGLVELSVRNYAEGCLSTRVGYVEGIFVAPHRRRKGVSQELFRAAERWALRQGCFEMASDTEIHSRESPRMHRKAGFSEVERTIHFKKSPLLVEEVDGYCSEQAAKIYSTYLQSEEPWKQSGFRGPQEKWVALRRPIADCVTKPGSFLDIGCANGYLLDSVLGWTRQRGIQTVPYGLDTLEELVAAARRRLPEYRENIRVGNGFTWNPSTRFDYVRTELCYVPEEFRKAFLNRLIQLFLKTDGVLLVAEYYSSNETVAKWNSETLKGMGFTVREAKSGFWEGRELTRVAVLPRQPNS